MKFLRTIMYTVGIVAAVTLSGNISSTQYRRQVSVDWGKLCYNRGPLSSEDYHACSAVALDCGDDGFLAHAFPPTGPIQVVTVNNVVEKIVGDCRRRNINPQNGQAFINAGSVKDLQQLVEDFTKQGIPIKVANTNRAPSPEDISLQGRSVYFDPLTDTFHVYMCKCVSGEIAQPER